MEQAGEVWSSLGHVIVQVARSPRCDKIAMNMVTNQERMSNTEEEILV